MTITPELERAAIKRFVALQLYREATGERTLKAFVRADRHYQRIIDRRAKCGTQS